MVHALFLGKEEKLIENNEMKNLHGIQTDRQNIVVLMISAMDASFDTDLQGLAGPIVV